MLALNEGPRLMRGADERSGAMFSYVSLEDRVPGDHPLRAVRRITDRALARMSRQFDRIYVQFGQPLDSAQAALARAAVAGAVYDSQRTPANVAARLQPVVPVVRGARRRGRAPTTFSKNRD